MCLRRGGGASVRHMEESMEESGWRARLERGPAGGGMPWRRRGDVGIRLTQSTLKLYRIHFFSRGLGVGLGGGGAEAEAPASRGGSGAGEGREAPKGRAMQVARGV